MWIRLMYVSHVLTFVHSLSSWEVNTWPALQTGRLKLTAHLPAQKSSSLLLTQQPDSLMNCQRTFSHLASFLCFSLDIHTEWAMFILCQSFLLCITLWFTHYLIIVPFTFQWFCCVVPLEGHVSTHFAMFVYLPDVRDSLYLHCCMLALIL